MPRGNRRQTERTPVLYGLDDLQLVLHRHGVGVDRLLARHAFEGGEDAAVFVFVALHGEATFFVAIGPGESDVVFLRLGQRHERADAEADNGESDGSADAAVHVLSVADFGDGRGGNADEFRFVGDEDDFVLRNFQFERGAGFGVGERTAVVGDFVSALRVGGEEGEREGDGKKQRE